MGASHRLFYGAEIEIWHGDTRQYLQHFPVHGYLSSVDYEIHLGLGLDSIANFKVHLANGQCYENKIIKPNKTILLKEEMFRACVHQKELDKPVAWQFQDNSDKISPPFKHQESEFNDFECISNNTYSKILRQRQRNAIPL